MRTTGSNSEDNDTTDPEKPIVPDTIMYFSATGDDANQGTLSSPKKNPSPYIASGNYDIRLKGGDVFTLRKQSVGSNTRISTYGGDGQAVIDCQNLSVNTLRYVGNNIYEMDLNEDNIGFVRIEDSEEWLRTRVTNGGIQYWGWEVDEDNEWSHIDGKFRIYSETDISGKKIYYTYGDGLHFKNVHDIIVENIELCNCGNHGLNIWTNNRRITVKDCYIHNIGGNMQESHRLGNAVQIWSVDNHDILIDHNRIDMCYDTGITAQGNNSTNEPNADVKCTNIRFTRNHVTNCAWCIEFWNTNEAGMEIEVDHNFSEWSRDITDGNRDWSSTRTGLLCIWNDVANDTYNIHDNVFMHVVKNSYNPNASADVIADTEEYLGNWTCANNTFVSATHKINNHKNAPNVPITTDSFIAISSDYPTDQAEIDLLNHWREVGESLIV